MSWHIGHIFALFVLFFVSFIAIREMQVILAMIEEAGFNPAEYDRPTNFFAIRAIVITLFTSFVGYKTRKTNSIIGIFLFGLGILFFIIALAMLIKPRFINILDLYGYWRVYCASGILLSIAAIGGNRKAENPLSKYGDDILDDIL